MRVGSSLAVLLLLAARVTAEPAGSAPTAPAAPPASTTSVAPATRTSADQAFQRGRAAMKAHRYREACAAFEVSQRLDPQLGTQFNIANCDVEIGKLASAWKIYRKLATTDANADRKALSADLAKKLEPRLPRLLVVVAAAPAGLAVAIDDDAAGEAGSETPVDVGEHVVSVTAPGYQKHRETVTAREGALATLRVTLVPDANAPQSSTAAGTASTDAGIHATGAPIPRERYGKIAVIGGSALIVGGLVIGAFAISDWDHAKSATGADRTSRSHRAVVLGNVSTATVIVGLIPTAVGVYLWRTSGSSAQLAPTAGTDGAGVTLLGTF